MVIDREQINMNLREVSTRARQLGVDTGVIPVVFPMSIHGTPWSLPQSTQVKLIQAVGIAAVHGLTIHLTPSGEIILENQHAGIIPSVVSITTTPTSGEQVDVLRETIEHITADTPGRGERIQVFFDMVGLKNTMMG